MGALFSRWRAKPSTEEVLEKLNQDIESLEQFKRDNQELQKRYVGALVFYSIVLYIASALIFYFYYLPTTWNDRLYYSSPLLVFPGLIWLMKKVLHWYFVKRISQNEIALEECKEKKKEILEDVMDKETYKKAKEILEKYDPERFRELQRPRTQSPSKATPTDQNLRQRTAGQRGTPSQETPGPSQITATPQVHRPTPARGRGMPPNSQMRPGFGPAPGPPMPRHVLPLQRSAVDKVVDYLVGDGPQNRYALICKSCHSHNGMAMKEEFEYLNFRCCYCYTMNEAKKTRPVAPKLETPVMRRKKMVRDDAGSDVTPVVTDDDSIMTDDDDRPAMGNGKLRQALATNEQNKKEY